MRNLALFVAMLCGTTALHAQATDPWRKVPAAPTTYFNDQAFSSRLHELAVEVGEQRRNQTEINERISLEHQKLGAQEIMQRTQAFMAKDPQKFMKMMEAQAARAQQVGQQISSGNDPKKERDAEFEQLSAAFKAELEAAAKPYQAKREEIKKTGAVSVLEGASWAFKTKAAETAYNEQVDKENADISARSAGWFGPSGKFTAWLASYRATVIDPKAKREEEIEEVQAMQLAIMETPAAAFRSTAQFTAVREYLEMMRKAYDLRIHKEPNVHRMAGEP